MQSEARATTYQETADPTKPAMALKFTERIEREVLVVAAIVDSDNFRINNINKEYTKQQLFKSNFCNEFAIY